MQHPIADPFAILPKHMEIGFNNIYCVSPAKIGSDSSKSQHVNHMGVSSQGASGLGGRSYYKKENNNDSQRQPQNRFSPSLSEKLSSNGMLKITIYLEQVIRYGEIEMVWNQFYL